MMRRLDSRAPDFDRALSQLAVPQDSGDRSVAQTVSDIIADVEARGNTALIE
jgi:histidinol dehydrogenase